jgi:PAS domain S-box-containing protein
MDAADFPPNAPASKTLSLLHGERRVLAQIAAGVPLQQVLEELLLAVEAQSRHGLKTSILFYDPATQRVRTGVAPSLPAAYNAALDGLPIGPHAGSCGTAIARGEAVYVSDIETDPLWDDYRELALAHGLRACWSTPIFATDGSILGAFAQYFPEPRTPAANHVESLAIVSQTAALAIERHLSDRKLREAEARHRQILNSATDYAIISLDRDGLVTSWNEGAHRILGWTEAEMLGQTVHRFFTPQDVAGRRIEREMQMALEQGFASDESWRVRRSGARFWASGQMTPLRDDQGCAIGFVKILRDRTRQRAADLRQAFLLELTESLHDAEDAPEVSDIVADKLRQLLDVSRVGFGWVREGRIDVTRDWTDGRVASIAGSHPLSAYDADLIQALQAGQVVAVNDVEQDPRAAGSAPRYRELQIRSLMLVPLIEAGALTGLIFINAEHQRSWRDDEIALAREVGERMRMAAERTRSRQAVRESEERLHVAQQAGGIGTFEIFPERGAVAVSEQFCRLWGLAPQPELKVADLLELVLPEDRTRLATINSQLPDTALEYVEYRIQRPDTGELRWMARRGEPLRDPLTGRLRYLGVSYDITERKRAVEELATSQESLHLATDAAEIGTWDLDLTTDTLSWPPRTKAMFGISPDGTCSMADFYAGLHPEDREATSAAFASAVDPARRATYDVEYRTIGKEDGVVRWVAAKGRGIFDATGRCVRAVGTAIDITSTKAAAARQAFLLELTDRLRPLTVPHEILACAVQALCAHLGVERAGYLRIAEDESAELEIEHAPQLPPLDADGLLQVFGKRQLARLRQGYTSVDEDQGEAEPQLRSLVAAPLLRENRLGAVFYAGQRSPRHWNVGEISLIEDVASRTWDAVERARAEEALRDETQTLETLNRTGSMLATDLGLDTVVQRVVDAGVELSGAQFGAFFYNVLDDEGGSYMLYALAGANASDFKFGMPRATAVFAPTFRGEGTIRCDDITADPRYGRSAPHHGMPAGHLPVRSYLAVPVASRSGEVIGGLFFGHPQPGMFSERAERLVSGIAAQAAIAIDNARLLQSAQRLADTLETRVQERTRELEEAQEALRQSQKMEAVGQLTGGIAHDFNNLLQGITGSLEVLKRRVQQGRIGDLEKLATNAMASAGRAAALTHRLLAFSRRQPLDPKPVQVNPLVVSMEDLLRRTLGERVELVLMLGGDLWLTLCDPNQLESAILNLSINARDAMPGGGKLVIETGNAEIDAAYAARSGDIRPGQYVCISVTDTGTGMPPEVVARAFEPFFTTKPLGQGTGLGLSMIYGFARQSEGQVRIASEVGRGTTVKLYLPCHAGTHAAHEAAATPPAAPRGDAGETVLVIEDESVVRSLVVELLRELGYAVLQAEDGPSGLAILQSGRRIDLLVTDVGLPGLNGRQVADAARLLRPQLKVLFMTGYAENTALPGGFLQPGMELITKPFEMDALAQRLREMSERA